MKRERNSGRRLLLSTFLLVGLSGISLALAIHSIGQLLRGLDVLYVLLLGASLYATIVGVYSTATIFYNVDKISGRQKRTVRILEFHGTREEGSE
jgi:hypothetical protein